MSPLDSETAVIAGPIAYYLQAQEYPALNRNRFYKDFYRKLYAKQKKRGANTETLNSLRLLKTAKDVPLLLEMAFEIYERDYGESFTGEKKYE